MTIYRYKADADMMSWGISHLNALTDSETSAMIDLMRSWCNGTSWSCAREVRMTLLVEFAERHGFAGVFRALAHRGLAEATEEDERLEKRYFTNFLYHDKCMAICRRLQCLARQMGIPFVVIKGPVLAIEGYGDTGIRSYSDIDVLTDSFANAVRLIEAADGTCEEAAQQNSAWLRMNHPGRLHAMVDNWEVEFCYPLQTAGDPMVDLMHRHRHRLLTIPRNDQDLAAPDASLHMVILIQHMARHLCNRFIWFFDLAVFERANREKLNWTWIQQELELLQMTHIGHWISRFCRRYLSREFPLITCSKPGWNTRFHAAVTAPEHISGRISLFHKYGWRKHFKFILSPARFYLITDPEAHRRSTRCRAAVWLSSRLMHAFGWKASWLHRWLTVCCAGPMLLLSRTVSHILMAAEDRSIRCHGSSPSLEPDQIKVSIS